MIQGDMFTIQMNIVRYREMLKSELDKKTRETVERLLSEAEGDLLLATDLKGG